MRYESDVVENPEVFQNAKLKKENGKKTKNNVGHVFFSFLPGGLGSRAVKDIWDIFKLEYHPTNAHYRMNSF